MEKKRGGSRPNSGAKKKHQLLKKRPVCIKLPGWLLAWMDENYPRGRAVLIEDAIKKVHIIKPPEIK